MGEVEARLDELLAELAGAEVRFCVVRLLRAGGARGAPRGRVDMDVVPESSQQNLVRLAEALARLGAALEPGGATTTLSLPNSPEGAS